MFDKPMMEKVVKELYALRRQHGRELVGITSKESEAKDIITKFSSVHEGTFSADDPSILDEARRQLASNKAVVIIAYGARLQYELYSTRL